MIHASVRMKVVPGKFTEARDILLALVEPTEVAPGLGLHTRDLLLQALVT